MLFGEFDVASEEVHLLRQATEKGDSHAIGNLALIYLRAGLVSDAQNILDSAGPSQSHSERVTAARQEIHKSLATANEHVEKLTAQAEKLASAFAKFNFEGTVSASTYVGRWISVDGGETLEISTENFYTKIVHSSDRDKRYIYSFSLSAITVTTASKEESPPTSLVSMLMKSGTDVVLLMEPANIRLLDIDGSAIKKQVDFRRFD